MVAGRMAPAWAAAETIRPFSQAAQPPKRPHVKCRVRVIRVLNADQSSADGTEAWRAEVGRRWDLRGRLGHGRRGLVPPLQIGKAIRQDWNKGVSRSKTASLSEWRLRPGVVMRPKAEQQSIPPGLQQSAPSPPSRHTPTGRCLASRLGDGCGLRRRGCGVRLWSGLPSRNPAVPSADPIGRPWPSEVQQSVILLQ